MARGVWCGREGKRAPVHTLQQVLGEAQWTQTDASRGTPGQGSLGQHGAAATCFTTCASSLDSPRSSGSYVRHALSDPARLRPSWPASPSWPSSPQVLGTPSPHVSAKAWGAAVPRQPCASTPSKDRQVVAGVTAGAWGAGRVQVKQCGGRALRCPARRRARKKRSTKLHFSSQTLRTCTASNVVSLYFRCSFAVVSMKVQRSPL